MRPRAGCDFFAGFVRFFLAASLLSFRFLILSSMPS